LVSEYFCGVLFPGRQSIETEVMITAFTSLALFYVLNLFGLKTSSRIQNVLTIIKIGLVLLLICSVFIPVEPGTETLTPKVTTLNSPTDYITAFGACLIAVCFSFTGYQQVINFGGETKNAKKILPGSIKVGLFIIIVLYLLINYAYVEVIGFEELKTSGSIAALLAERLFGPHGYTILSVLIYLSVLGYVNANLMACPRIMYAMGEDRALPKMFATATKNGTMAVSLTTFTAIALITLLFAKTFDKLLNYTVFLDCISAAFAAATIFYFRRKTTDDTTGIYKVSFYPVLPIIFIAAFLFVAFSIFASDPGTAAIGLAIFVVFAAAYFITARFGSNSN
jgi:APA family basic amino acid/polyamine antiporter